MILLGIILLVFFHPFPEYFGSSHNCLVKRNHRESTLITMELLEFSSSKQDCYVNLLFHHTLWNVIKHSQSLDKLVNLCTIYEVVLRPVISLCKQNLTMVRLKNIVRQGIKIHVLVLFHKSNKLFTEELHFVFFRERIPHIIFL